MGQACSAPGREGRVGRDDETPSRVPAERLPDADGAVARCGRHMGLRLLEALLPGEGAAFVDRRRIGVCFTGKGDVDGDGAPDLIVGAPGNGDSLGRAFLVR